jgi:hypothetical protein
MRSQNESKVESSPHSVNDSTFQPMFCEVSDLRANIINTSLSIINCVGARHAHSKIGGKSPKIEQVLFLLGVEQVVSKIIGDGCGKPKSCFDPEYIALRNNIDKTCPK